MKRIGQAVILAGGRGERLRPLTDNVPKPLVPVAGKPFLEHLVLLLKENQIERFLFLIGYRGDKIRSYFGDGSQWGVEIEYSLEETPLGTGGALRLAKDFLEDEFFLLFGDSYLPIDYVDMADEYGRSKKQCLLAVYDNAEPTDVPFNVALDRGTGRVLSYKKQARNTPEYRHCDAGVLAVRKAVVGLISDPAPVSFEEAVYPSLIGKDELGFYLSKTRFYDIGTMDRLKIFEQYLLRRKNK